MFAKLFTTLMLILSLLFQNFSVIPIRHADNISLKAVLISDIHADADPVRDRNDLLREGFAAIGRTQNDADTLVMSGDLTNSGDLREYLFLLEYINTYCRIPDRVPEIGNHDSWHHSDDPDFTKAEKYFKLFCVLNGVCTDKVYYKKQVKGYTFIVLGVEDCDFKTPYLSEEQLCWFEEELSAACEENKPVFVVCHKPVDCMGDSEERLSRVLTESAASASAPIVYISGHHHNDFDENSLQRPEENLIYLNLPSFLDNDGAPGAVLEVTDSTVTLTGCSFLEEKPVEGFSYVVEGFSYVIDY
ncbi:MAG: metallophosphoesterase [Clostridia bacterium]|nr:metallophosphoesterase [Clostridia bacterium]